MFQVKGINNFLRQFLTESSFVRKKLTKNHGKLIFGGFIPKTPPTIFILMIKKHADQGIPKI